MTPDERANAYADTVRHLQDTPSGAPRSPQPAVGTDPGTTAPPRANAPHTATQPPDHIDITEASMARSTPLPTPRRTQRRNGNHPTDTPADHDRVQTAIMDALDSGCAVTITPDTSYQVTVTVTNAPPRDTNPRPHVPARTVTVTLGIVAAARPGALAFAIDQAARVATTDTPTT